ncbi:MAG: hypothetical protein IPI92_12495 [Gemmatimonadetes bacterium]|nr:hypothetical protein [Gemmatimonadota bacterium]MBK7785830.1 hypothetical protein [Gemmatimonadota bacterium]
MRTPGFFFLAAAALCLTAPAALRAQDHEPNPQLREVPDDDAVEDERDDPAPVERRRPRGEDDRARARPDRRAPLRRGGYYASVGVGAGSEAVASLGVPSPYVPSRVRPTVNIGFGAGVGQALRVGFEGFAWFNVTGDGALETVTTAMVGARVYPIPTSGLYLRAAGGFGRYGQDLLDDYCDCSAPIVQDYGLAWAVGGGFEVPAGNGLWIGPSVEMIRMNIDGPDGYRERVLNFGITLTFDGHH